MSKFALGREEDVRRVFPATIECSVMALGSNGFVVTGFSAMYPRDLNIFIPIDYITNSVSSAIPAEFEGFFSPLDDYLDYFYRLVETEIPSSLKNSGVEYAIGSFSGFDYKSGHHTTFAVPIGNSNKASTLLCRRQIFAPRGITAQDTIKRYEAEFHPSFIETADDPSDGQCVYLYWSMSPSQVFSNSELTFATLMATTPKHSSRQKLPR